MKIIPILKAEEKTAGGRVYSLSAFENAYNRILWHTKIPFKTHDRSGYPKDIKLLKKDDIIVDKQNKTLSVKLEDSDTMGLYGLSLAPEICVEKVRKIDKDSVLIEDFTIEGIQATQDLCSFKSIDSIVK